MKADIEREKMCFILELRKITASNMESIYNEKLHRFCYYKSSKATVDGKEIPQGFDRFLATITPENKEKTATLNLKTYNEFDISETDFIEDEILRVERLLNLYQTEIEYPQRKAGAMYLEFLRNQLEAIGKNEGKKSHDNLQELINSETIYQSIMDLLADKKKVDGQTHKWSDESKGNKKVLIVILKQLELKGYFNIKRKLTAAEIQAICRNTFGHEVSIDLIKKTAHDDYNIGFEIPRPTDLTQN